MAKRLEEIATATETITTLKNGIVVEDLPDYSKRLALPDSLYRGGLTVVFRDPSHADLEFMETAMKKGSNLEAMKRLACRLCTQWGERDGVTVPEWDKLRGVTSTALMEALSSYFPDRADADG